MIITTNKSLVSLLCLATVGRCYCRWMAQTDVIGESTMLVLTVYFAYYSRTRVHSLIDVIADENDNQKQCYQ